jgi:phytoene dehydrogenase-like protein
MPQYDAVVVGSGPNGLAAAVELARAGWSVAVHEARTTVGGGLRTLELTLPGFRHDVCSTVHPMGVSSPVFARWPLQDWGLQWLHPPLPLAHPFEDGTAAVLARSLDETAAALPHPDGAAWRRLMRPLVQRWDELIADAFGPLHVPRHPFLLARFGLRGLRSTTGLAQSWFRDQKTRALFAGMAAHVMMRLEQRPTAAFGLVLGAAGHAAGWPVARGGSQSIADALGGYLQQLGGKLVLGHEVKNVDELPSATAVLFDLTPRQVVRIAGHRLPARYVRALQRYRHGSGVFKVDWALSGPVPWRHEACRRAGTVHVGGTMAEIAVAETAAWRGEICERPFVLVAQQSIVDPSRAPEGRQTLWGYCHVPSASGVDMTERIEAQIERVAPGFRDTVLARHTLSAQAIEQYNPNYIGGDINGGVQDL